MRASRAQTSILRMGHLFPRLISGLGANKPDSVAAANTPARVDVGGPFTER